MKEQLDISGTDPEPGSHPMSLKIKPGVFPSTSDGMEALLT